jgi:hypothetical protein
MKNWRINSLIITGKFSEVYLPCEKSLIALAVSHTFNACNIDAYTGDGLRITKKMMEAVRCSLIRGGATLVPQCSNDE